MKLHQLTWQEICRMIPKRKTDAQKGDFGRLLCITGSRNMPGACLLSTQAALRGGAGLVTVATAPENPMRLAAAAPEAMWLSLETDENGFLTNSSHNRELLLVHLRRANGVLLGCGLGVTEETKRLVRWVLETAACPVVLDADGLNCAVSCIELSRRTGTDWILTPHPGEMARLTGQTIPQIQENHVETAAQFAAAYPVTLALKGAGTLRSPGDSLLGGSLCRSLSPRTRRRSCRCGAFSAGDAPTRLARLSATGAGKAGAGAVSRRVSPSDDTGGDSYETKIQSSSGADPCRRRVPFRLCQTRRKQCQRGAEAERQFYRRDDYDHG